MIFYVILFMLSFLLLFDFEFMFPCYFPKFPIPKIFKIPIFHIYRKRDLHPGASHSEAQRQRSEGTYSMKSSPIFPSLRCVQREFSQPMEDAASGRGVCTSRKDLREVQTPRPELPIPADVHALFQGEEPTLLVRPERQTSSLELHCNAAGPHLHAEVEAKH